MNQRLPSGPAVMLRGLLPSDPSVGRGKAVKLPAGVRRPMVSVVSAAPSVNQRLPSGPLVMPNASQPSLATQTPNPELGEAARGGDAPNVVRRFGEPEVAIRSGRDGVRPTASRGPTGRWQGELGETARGGDAPDGVHIWSREPEVAIRPGRDA